MCCPLNDHKSAMPQHSETRILPYAPEQIFALVADVERYPEFLPWCVACRVTARPSPTEFIADLAVGFKGSSKTET